MNLVPTKDANDNIVMAWVTKLKFPKRKKNYEALINHIGSETEFTNKWSLVGVLHSAERWNNRLTPKRNVGNRLKSIPETYNMDSAEMRKKLLIEANEGDYWIKKPSHLNRGLGISLITNIKKLHQVIQRIDSERNSMKNDFAIRRPSGEIIQRYIKNPLLINGKKFDIRSYMLIACTSPFLVLHDPGYARLSLHNYTLDNVNTKTHLTNQCIQMKDANYEKLKEETVMSMDELNNYLNIELAEQEKIEKNWVFNTLQKKQHEILKNVIVGMRGKIMRSRGQFGLYGCDFLIDADMNVWLLEINLGPALTTNTSVLKAVIPNVLKQTIEIAVECYDKNRLGLDALPLITNTKMTIVYSETKTQIPRSNSLNMMRFVGPFTIEKKIRHIKLVGKYDRDLKQKAIEDCLKRSTRRNYRRRLTDYI